MHPRRLPPSLHVCAAKKKSKPTCEYAIGQHQRQQTDNTKQTEDYSTKCETGKQNSDRRVEDGSQAAWFGKSARLKFVAWEEYGVTVTAEDAKWSWAHLLHCSSYSIVKARRVLDYQPRYSSLDGVSESLVWLIEHGKLKHDVPQPVS